MPRLFPVLAVMTAVLSGCREPAQAPAAAATRNPNVAGYLAPPNIEKAGLLGRQLVLTGVAPPDARVRMAAPGGAPQFADADRHGRWRLTLGPSPEARIYGLSASSNGRAVQALGYVLVTPSGRVVLLRSGSGAQVIGGGNHPRITAVDFDQAGGAMVSGWSEAETDLSVRVDERQRAEGRSDASGRFAIALPELEAGPHTVQVLGRGEFGAQLQVSPPPPFSGAFRAHRVTGGLRVDWRTPAGGVQSTVIVGGA